MPEIKELGTVIASREMEFIFDGSAAALSKHWAQSLCPVPSVSRRILSPDRPAAGKRHNGSTLGPYPAIGGFSPSLCSPWLGDGRKEKAYLKVGMPFEYNENLDWCSPYELSTESSRKLFGMIGIDALQALELTMKTLRVEIEHWERNKGGKFYFLNEEGAAI
jgi:hypothetical protein